MPVDMFDKDKGACRYCHKETRSSATSLCNACYRLQVAVKNNPMAAQRMINEHRANLDLETKNPYAGTRPKEAQ